MKTSSYCLFYVCNTSIPINRAQYTYGTWASIHSGAYSKTLSSSTYSK